MTRKQLIETAEAIIASDILTKSDGTRTKGAKSISRHLTFVKNKTGDTKYHQKKLGNKVANVIEFYELEIS